MISEYNYILVEYKELLNMTDVHYKEKIEDILIDPSKSVIVIADTHLGAQGEHSSRPLILNDFLKWVKKLEEGKESISVELGSWGDGKKVLKPPQELILLGDIIELWDATDRSIDFCSRPIFDLLGDLSCNKIYVLGNHDNDLIDLIRREVDEADEEENKFTYKYEKYPINKSPILFLDGMYPTITNIGTKGTNVWGQTELSDRQQYLRTVNVGGQHYLFLHGHQFDKYFKTLPQWKWMAKFRTAAMAFGSYTWIFVTLFIIDLILTVYFGNYELLNLMLLLLLTSVAVPFLIIQFGRRVFNSFRTRKYDRSGGLEGFIDYWKSDLKEKYHNSKTYWEREISAKTEKIEDPLSIIYGHTHLTDLVFLKAPDNVNYKSKRFQDLLKQNEESLEANLQRRNDIDKTDMSILFNLPAWSKDLSTSEREEVLQAVFLYLDDEGSFYFGWDWNEEQPFLIPKELIRIRREKYQVVKEDEDDDGFFMESDLQSIGWNTHLIDEWKKKCKL